MRIAIDISIWQFQIQSGKGGTNPALRTLYYRLLRLLALTVQPLFVFDGKNKPAFKRYKKTQSQGVSLPNYLAKQLLKLLGFPFHVAPGEAEAECALLQKSGIVDAVLSEDVDTLMFGCSLTLRNWSSEEKRGNKSPTHVDMYQEAKTKESTGIDSQGMILVALMSGGDYIPAGIPNCGIKTACEAAKAGFGYDLCQLSKRDATGFRKWRERLTHELHTNQSRFFRSKHKALEIPDDFPNIEVLGYYTNPAISSSDQVNQLSSNISWTENIDVKGLRLFVEEAFEWTHRSGAEKFIRGLAPALLAYRLFEESEKISNRNDSLEEQKTKERQLISAICGRRTHHDTDCIPELRVVYIPTQIAKFDFDTEDRSPHECDHETAFEAEVTHAEEEIPRNLNEREDINYNPTKPVKIWLPETYVQLGVPLLVEKWEEDMRDPKKFASRKARERKIHAPETSRQTVIGQYMRISKPVSQKAKSNTNCSLENQNESESRRPASVLQTVASLPCIDLSSKASPNAREPKSSSQTGKGQKGTGSNRSKQGKIGPETISREKSARSSQVLEINPWTLSKRPSDTFNVKISSASRYSALGIYGSSSPRSASIEPHEERPSEFSSDLEDNIQRSQPSKRSCDIKLPQYKRSDLGSNLSGEKKFLDSLEPELIKVNRRLNLFPEIVSLDDSPVSSQESLLSRLIPESPITMKSSSPIQHGGKTHQQVPASSTEASARRNIIMLRQSLEGAWKLVDPKEAEGISTNMIYEEVDTVDLSER